MTSPNPQEGSDVVPETADGTAKITNGTAKIADGTVNENVAEWEDNGLMLELAPFKLEKIIEYEPGGYHPVHLGDVLGDVYRIIHKFGYGGFATVWPARDLNAKDTTKYVALKIIKADSSGDDCPELLMDRLADEIGEGEGPKYLCFPLDRFKVDGPNGPTFVLSTLYWALGSPMELFELVVTWTRFCDVYATGQ